MLGSLTMEVPEDYDDVEIFSPARFTDYANRNGGYVDNSHPHLRLGEL
jgi:hypothetical protein